MTRTHKTQTTQKQAPSFIAYHVPDRDNAPWTSLGAAWAHDDGKGFTLQLELMPVAAGRIVLRALKPKEDEKAPAEPPADPPANPYETPPTW